MKTKAHAQASAAQMKAPMPTPSVAGRTLDVLLQQPVQKNLPKQVDGLMIGTLVHLDETGQPQVQPEGIKEGPFTAISTVALKPDDVGAARFVLGFQEGNPRKPIILGRVWVPPNEMVEAASPNGQTPEYNIEGTLPRKIRLHAGEELELRCGTAAILLQADGYVLIRGRYISHQAEAGLRLRGGSLQAN